jgi:hypothetical protein
MGHHWQRKQQRTEARGKGSPRAERRALTPSLGQEDKRQGHGVPLGSPDSPSQCSLTGSTAAHAAAPAGENAREHRLSSAPPGRKAWVGVKLNVEMDDKRVSIAIYGRDRSQTRSEGGL